MSYKPSKFFKLKKKLLTILLSKSLEVFLLKENSIIEVSVEELNKFKIASKDNWLGAELNFRMITPPKQGVEGIAHLFSFEATFEEVDNNSVKILFGLD